MKLSKNSHTKIPEELGFSGIFGLYVNSWGRAKRTDLTTKELRRAAAPLLLGANGTMEYSVAETIEVANTETNAFQNLGFVVASLGEAVGIVAIERSEDFIRPVVNSFSTSTEFGKISSLGKIYPLCNQLSADAGIGSVHEFYKLIL